MDFKIYLSPPSHSEKEIKTSKGAIDSNWISTQGNYIDTFKQDLETYFDTNVLLTNSGTSAIHLALIAAGVKRDDLVLCSNFTFAASAFPILYQEALPVFVGCETETWNMSPTYLKSALDNLVKKPKALILTHVYGMPANLNEIKSICKEYDIVLIEDAAEAMGSEFDNQKVGTFGDFGIISFNGNKIITCSSGGALLSHDADQLAYAKKIASQAKENVDYYKHEEVGYNYLQSNILAAIGQAQFSSLKERVEKRRATFNYYKKAFSDFSEIASQIENEFSYSNYWLSSFIFPEGKNHLIKENLKNERIESRYLFNPLNQQKVFRDFLYFGDEIELQWFKKGLSLPSGFELTIEQQDLIINLIKNSL